MTTSQWILALAATIIPWIVVFFVVRWAKKNNYQQGRRAYHDGLPYNPKWGPDICRGWRDASREIPL